MYPMFVCVCIYIYITYIYTHTPLYLVRVHIMYLFAVSPAPALSLSAAVDERADIKRIVRARSPPPPFAPPPPTANDASRFRVVGTRRAVRVCYCLVKNSKISDRSARISNSYGGAKSFESFQ